MLAAAADVLSGPAGLAAYLRTGVLGGAAAAISLPLDTGKATDSIPAHLRRLVMPAGPALPVAAAATSRPRGVTRTTSGPAAKAARTAWSTWHYSAPSTTS